MPAGDIDQYFPKKSRMENLQLEDLHENEAQAIKNYYNKLLNAGYQNDEALALANDEAYKMRQRRLVEEATERYIIEKQEVSPRPPRNLTSDVTVRRMTEFLKFMNKNANTLSDDEVLDAIDNEWSDVIDMPTSVWDSDVYGLTLYMIGGGRIVPSDEGYWLYIDDSEPLNTC